MKLVLIWGDGLNSKNRSHKTNEISAMKIYGNLFDQIVSFENLWLASRQAQKGKRFQENVLQFNYHLES
jgi:hypothetical protein